MKILLAEDVAVSRKMLESYLRRQGREVVAVGDGLEAWRRLQDEHLRLVVADWMMPGMDGIELVRKIRERNSAPYVYVILLTSRDERDDRLAGLAAGADDYITKPFDQEELLSRIRAGERVLELERKLAVRNEQLRRLALLDELTGVGNRRAYEHTIRSMTAQADRSGAPLALAMVDIDHFKLYNDGLGHEAGDRVLRRVADAIGDTVRASDFVFRYGGEEFVALFPLTDGSGAAVVCERLRKEVEALEIEHPGNPPHGRVTVSVGWAVFDPRAEAAGDRLLDDADQAMYRAKHAGRNRIASSERRDARAG